MAFDVSDPVAPSGAVRELRAPESGPLSVAVRVVPDTGTLASLPRHLPAGWHVSAGSLGPTDRYDVVLLDHGTAEDVLAVRRHAPDAEVLAVVAPHTSAAEVVAILHAGADACIRSEETVVVAAHLRAHRRRRLLSQNRTVPIR